MSIADNLREVRERIAEAERAAGRVTGSAQLVAVSKTVPAASILEALAAGHVDFGESYGQEFRDKRAAVEEGARAAGLPQPRWHFIGPLQTNKVKYVAGKVALLHAVDSADVLAELERRLVPLDGPPQDCLIQVNVAAEPQKRGIAPAALPGLLDRFAGLTRVHCLGLMVIPPFGDDAELSRAPFVALRQLREAEAQRPRPNVDLRHLSMGMSHDLEIAIAEGATLVRVGTAIFGART